ncbi:MAG: GSCFA domain-containing protein [Magnetococcus sp. YQC-3]
MFSVSDIFSFVCEQLLGGVPHSVIRPHLLGKGISPDTVDAIFKNADACLAHEPSRHVILGASLLQKRDQDTSKVVAAEGHFRRALELSPRDANAWYLLGKSLENQGRTVEALSAYEKSLSIDPTNPRAVAGKSSCLETIAPLDGREEMAGSKRTLYTRFPETLASISDLDRAVAEHILQHVNSTGISISHSTKVVTVGSCFASNVSLALKAQGVDSVNLTIGEAANSTFANRMIVDDALRGKRIDGKFVPGTLTEESIANSLRTADLLIYTLGVAPCFFDAQTGEFVPSNGAESVRGVAKGKYIFRNTTVDENVTNLLAVIDAVRAENPDCQFVISLSPVPLQATLEQRSAMEADCLSKSILRVSAEQVVSLRPRCIYWPSFEIIRWLGAYIPGMYGAEDGTPWHVSDHVIKTIMKHFVRIFYRPSS